MSGAISRSAINAALSSSTIPQYRQCAGLEVTLRTWALHPSSASAKNCSSGFQNASLNAARKAAASALTRPAGAPRIAERLVDVSDAQRRLIHVALNLDQRDRTLRQRPIGVHDRVVR